MNHVHPIFSPIVEQIANQHFVAAVDRVFGILDKPPIGCKDCGAPLGYDDIRCDRHADEIAEERRENGRWDDLHSEWEDAA
jgi:hypothetical protein